MVFLGKVLSVRAKDYCESVKKGLEDYMMQGGNRISTVSNFPIEGRVPEKFLEIVPEEAEVVTDYNTSVALAKYDNEGLGGTECLSYIVSASGTALIKK